MRPLASRMGKFCQIGPSGVVEHAASENSACSATNFLDLDPIWAISMPYRNALATPCCTALRML